MGQLSTNKSTAEENETYKEKYFFLINFQTKLLRFSFNKRCRKFIDRDLSENYLLDKYSSILLFRCFDKCY